MEDFDEVVERYKSKFESNNAAFRGDVISILDYANRQHELCTKVILFYRKYAREIGSEAEVEITVDMTLDLTTEEGAIT